MSFIDTDIIVGIIAALAAVLSASLPYYLTKRNEMKTKIKEIKLARYDTLLSKLTEFISDPNDWNARHQFIVAYNQASGYADNDVINACHEFLSSMVPSDEWDRQKTNDAINHIFKAIRKDINPKAPYSNFAVFSAPKNHNTTN